MIRLTAFTLTLFFFQTSCLHAAVLPNQSVPPQNGRPEKIEEISKIKDKFYQSILYSETPQMSEKIESMNAVLKIEEGLLAESRLRRLKEETEAQLEKKKAEEKARAETTAKPKKDEVTFRIKAIRFSGNELVSSKELQPLVEEYLKRDITFSEVEEAVSRIKRYYRSKGYIATYVYVPPQSVKEGTLQIDIVEGRLGNLEIVGNRWFSKELLKKHFDLKSNEIIRYDILRLNLEQLNRHRDVKAKAVLKPGAKIGTTDVEIKVQDKRPFHLGVDANNRGTRNTGKYRYGVSASHTNLTGKMDELSGRLQLGKKTWAVASDYNIPLNYKKGTRLGFGVSHASVDVGGDFAALGIEGEATTYSVYVLHPIIRKINFRTTLQAGFDWKSVENRSLGARSGEDELRIFKTGLNFEQTDLSGKTFSSHFLNLGVSSFLGASNKIDNFATRPGTGGEFLVYNGSILRYFWLPHGALLSLRGVAQLTPDRLPPSEQLRLGGAFSVRGYQESEYLADYGTHGSAEVYIPAFFFPEAWKLPFSKETLRKQAQLFTFIDFGYGGIKSPLLGEKKDRFLAGTGLGLRLHLYDRFFGRFEWGFPLGGSRPLDDRDSTYYFGISYDFL